ncbi:MAG: multiubiquitin domain-containing protein [Dehalococcoidia bacterium]|nr:multiubiquitin domain-containing protein [Dehalococcoidia bacterium]
MRSQTTDQAGEGMEKPMKKAKYQVDIEGTLYDWDAATITVPQIRELGGLPEELPVLEIDLKTNEQRQLAEDEIINVKPGVGFSKKVRWARGC